MRVSADAQVAKQTTKFLSISFLPKFIQTYQDLPCLWKVDHEHYSVLSEREAAINKLIQVTREVIPDVDGTFVRAKIKTIRNSFRKEYIKVQNSQNTYVPKLWYYGLMGFLSEMRNRNLADGNSEKRYSPEDSEDFNNDMEENNVMDSSEKSATASNCDTPSRRKALKRPANLSSDVQREASRLCATNDVAEEDEYDILGTVVASKLQKMADRQRLIADKLISDILFKGLFNHLTTSSMVAD